ncbi:MAG: hypothetical protein OEV00_00450 [Acidobacteriota bacterium]|nr:hypothetical protein [Acidobacteriota bacterium]MDH3783773.1 hypothetical protein [Acidobacteriota bacterium]
MRVDGSIFSKRVIVILTTISVASFLLAFFFAGRGDDFFDSPDPRPNSYSVSAVGHRAFHDWAIKRGLEVRRRRSDMISSAAPSFAIVSIAPSLKLWKQEVDPSMSTLELDAFQASAPLVIAPHKWSGVAPPNQRWISAARREASTNVFAEVNEFLVYLELPRLALVDVETLTGCRDEMGNEYEVDIPRPRVWEPQESLRPTVSCHEGVLIGNFPAGEITAELYLISDPDLINNHGIGRGEHVEMLDAFLGTQLQLTGVEIDETLHGLSRQPSLIAALLSFPLVFLTLQGLLTLAIVVWHGVFRFGAPSTTSPVGAGRGKEILIDNAANLLDLRGHSQASLHFYYRSSLRLVGRTLFLDDDLSFADLEKRVLNLATSRPGGHVIHSIRRSIENYSEASRRSERAVRIARRLFRWRERFMHDT